MLSPRCQDWRSGKKWARKFEIFRPSEHRSKMIFPPQRRSAHRSAQERKRWNREGNELSRWGSRIIPLILMSCMFHTKREQRARSMNLSVEICWNLVPFPEDVWRGKYVLSYKRAKSSKLTRSLIANGHHMWIILARCSADLWSTTLYHLV